MMHTKGRQQAQVQQGEYAKAARAPDRNDAVPRRQRAPLSGAVMALGTVHRGPRRARPFDGNKRRRGEVPVLRLTGRRSLGLTGRTAPPAPSYVHAAL